ncbi:MAG: hypothetical protein ACYC3X_05570 [Pirellulaceae bacterium]
MCSDIATAEHVSTFYPSRTILRKCRSGTAMTVLSASLSGTVPMTGTSMGRRWLATEIDRSTAMIAMIARTRLAEAGK